MIFGKGRELISLPVINLQNGQRVGEVKDILYSIEEKRLVGFVLEEGGILRGSKVIFYNDGVNIGDDALTVENAGYIIDTRQDKNAGELLKKYKKNILDNKLITKDGEDLGVIKDLIFNFQTGELTGYELSEGAIQDLLKGRKEISLPVNAVIGHDTVVIDENIEKLT